MAPDRPASLASSARIFLQHFGHPDSDVAFRLMSDRVVYRVPGRSVLAGTFRGRDEVTAHLGKLIEITGGTMSASKIEDVMEGEQHVAAIVDTRAQGMRRTFHGRLLFVFAFDTDHLIEDLSVFPCDEAAVDRYFGQ